MDKPQPASTPWILGLDLGTNSIGWAALRVDDQRNPIEILNAGVRIFPAGTDGDISTGNDASRAVERREARLRRRQTDRRRRRKWKLMKALQDVSLLPKGSIDNPASRSTLLQELDEQIFGDQARKSHPHTLLYDLRRRALDEELSLHEFGRALYHLGQRRGFLSNRKSSPGTDEELGAVKSGISELDRAMQEAGSRTLGEYFSTINPKQQRIRQRWTSRAMYEEEFDAIWDVQQKYKPTELTPDVRQRIAKAIFHQRPLKSQKHLRGKCSLEPKRTRASMDILVSQRFRLIQKVNDLQLITTDGERRPLSPEERELLIDSLETSESLTFPKIRKLLGLPKATKFNFELGGEPKLPGNKTAARIAETFGEAWGSLSAEDRNAVVEDVRSIDLREARLRRAMSRWGLDEEQAEKLADVALEDGYMDLSKRAIERLLPLMEQGVAYATARKEIYGDVAAPRPVEALSGLDVFERSRGAIRNPVVTRTISQLRLVINALLREYGKPELIRLETTRDIKKPRKVRKDITKKNRQNERNRDTARSDIVAKALISEPTNTDILKWQLADECRWVCPYTGRQISPTSLYHEFDIEHIIPYHRSFDNSYTNKTLCYHEENRHKKMNKTPHEAYSGTKQYEEMLGRVERFVGEQRVVLAKLKRFRVSDPTEVDDFKNSQLNDTAWATRVAVEYLGTLFGANSAGIDSGGSKRIRTTTGGVTANVRNALGLNGILDDGGYKTREDHRHHAVDAVAIAITTDGMIKQISDAAKREATRENGHFKVAGVIPPWPSFLDDTRSVISRVVVSHRPSHKVNGKLHEETNYSADGSSRSSKKKVKNLIAIDGASTRHVVAGNNHHIEVFELKNGKWKGRLVNRFEAMNRLRRGLPVVDREMSDAKFLFTLAWGDTIEAVDADGVLSLYVIRGLNNDDRVTIVKASDARLKKDIVAAKELEAPRLNPLLKRKCRKVLVEPSGEVRPSND